MLKFSLNLKFELFFKILLNLKMKMCKKSCPLSQNVEEIHESSSKVNNIIEGKKDMLTNK